MKCKNEVLKIVLKIVRVIILMIQLMVQKLILTTFYGTKNYSEIFLFITFYTKV